MPVADDKIERKLALAEEVVTNYPVTLTQALNQPLEVLENLVERKRGTNALDLEVRKLIELIAEKLWLYRILDKLNNILKGKTDAKDL